MIYVRGAKEDFDHWASLGNKGWGSSDLLPLFRRLEDHEFAHSNGEYSGHYGNRGMLKVRQMQGAHPLSAVFVTACGELNVPPNPHYNAEYQEGASILCMTTSKRMRSSASQAFLQPAIKRGNLHVMKNTLVTKVIIRDKRAIGVCLSAGIGSPITEVYGGQIILSGGAINSPQLLMLSGIGPADHLRERNISVICHLPGVGRNLQDHPGIQLRAKVNVPTLSNRRVDGIHAAFDWLLRGRGPLMSAGYQALAFIKTRVGLPKPDVQLHMMPGAIVKDDKGVIRMSKQPCITLLCNVSYPKSRGEITLISNCAHDHPAIAPNMLGDDRDVSTLIAAGEFCRRLLETRSFRPFVEGEIAPGATVRTENEWIDYVRETAATSYHHSGTCKMGVDSTSVVDPTLKVIGIENLRVIDGSIIPTMISGNTNATCMVIGERGADIIMGIRDLSSDSGRESSLAQGQQSRSVERI
jgi:choline dehydrogenase